ncbi:hypothetical protein [Peribacillus butanolivorans]|uniref:Uncharacterized protein n=1 Tax=Peribacillus butanolivorans TaxID=421767 RepID=A0ABN5N991_9BACI|nr:hypothetical protein [Peribacillus butanolivorans]AXN41038.1 hypothetical protein DTO10_23445 [Peribacillus butanolivorans]
MQNNETSVITRKLTASTFQRQIFQELLDFLKYIRIKETAEGNFEKREPTKLLQYYKISELYIESKEEISQLKKNYPNLKSVVGNINKLLDVFKENDSNAFLLLDAYLQFSQLKKEYLKETKDDAPTYMVLKADQKHVYIEGSSDFIDQKPDLKNYFWDSVQNKKFLASIMSICKDVRNNKGNFSASEVSGTWFAYSLIEKGVTLDFAYRGIGTSGFRNDHQTLIFSTDPGDDHIRITSVHKTLMDGVAVHVEHIDRDKVADKEKVEAYRLPAAINATKVRLHISDDAPVTAFIGRPIFENGGMDIQRDGYITPENYEIDKLKSVHMTASACTTMFQNGVADCKVAIERMQSSVAVEFMKSVIGNVMRDTTRQTLAAAFNINTPINDDKYSNKEVKDRFEIAKLGIQIAVDGGFDRVTWDGADRVHVPSIPIIDQMSHQQFVQLVHKAHENGLQTYFSAGLEAKHIERCVITGVDGLGIGTSLHYTDKQSKLMGALNPKAIAEVLEKRNEAENTVLGKAAKLLAQLDRLYFEKNIYDEEDLLRNDLFNVILEQDQEKALVLIDDTRANRIKEIPYEVQSPVFGRAIRTIEFLKSKVVNNLNLTNKEEEKFSEIKTAIFENDIKRLQNVFQRIEY